MLKGYGLRKNYGARAVLDGVDLELRPGLVTAFVGPNGAGKSTLLAVLAGLVSPDGGDVELEGRRLRDWNRNERAKRISFLSQAPSTDLRLTVRDLVGFGRYPHYVSRPSFADDNKVDEAIALVGLSDRADDQLGILSGGQRRRAWIALMLAQDCPYALLDEPLNDLDLAQAASVMELLRRLADERRIAIAVVMHDLNAALSRCDYIVGLKDGRVFHSGRPDEFAEEAALTRLYGHPVSVRRDRGCIWCDPYDRCGPAMSFHNLPLCAVRYRA